MRCSGHRSVDTEQGALVELRIGFHPEDDRHHSASIALRPWPAGRSRGPGLYPSPQVDAPLGMVFLVVTVVADVTGVVLLGEAHGLERPVPLVAGVLALLIGFVMFSYATRTIPTGLANAVWAGVSILCLGMCTVAAGMNGDSFSDQRTDAFSIGIRCGSVCTCTRRSNSTSCRASVSAMLSRR